MPQHADPSEAPRPPQPANGSSPAAAEHLFSDEALRSSEEAPKDMVVITIATDGTLMVTGDIDLAGGPLLARAIAEAERREASAGGSEDDSPGHPDVAIDLSGVVFIDSSGLRSLLSANREALERGTRLRLKAPSPGVRRLLEITGTDEYFTIEGD